MKRIRMDGHNGIVIFILENAELMTKRQIKRWMNTAGPKSRFRRNLINQIHKKKTKYNDYEVSPKIRQTLQHWGYELQKSDLK